MQNTSFLKLVVIYVTVAAGVLLWSGSDKQKTLYDKYLITFQGIELRAHDFAALKYFMNDYLEFELKNESLSQLQFVLPDKKIINIFKNADKNSTSVTNSILLIKITVKNGLHQLHQKFEEKLAALDRNKAVVEISSVYKNNDKNEFTIKGPEDITFVFSQKNFFSK